VEHILKLAITLGDGLTPQVSVTSSRHEQEQQPAPKVIEARNFLRNHFSVVFDLSLKALS